MRNDNLVIDCGICVIRPYAARDAESLARHANNRRIWASLRDRFPHPYTLDTAHAWLEYVAAEDPTVSFAVDVHGAAVGGIGVVLGADVERTAAEIGYWLGEELWGRGIVTAAVRMFTDYAFEAYGLTRVFAVPFAGNAASRRVLEKSGYSLEAILRRGAIKEGVVIDQALYAVVR